LCTRLPACNLDGAIQLAEGGTLGQIDEFVVVTKSGEKTISLAQAKVRLQAAKEIAPAKQTVDGLMRKLLTHGLSGEDQIVLTEAMRQLDGYNTSTPGQ
jgi:hypothetical protein